MNNVLLVDDDRVVLNLLAEGLREHGYTVATAISAADAARLAEAQDFDLAVLDMRMPGQSGLDLAREFRARGAPSFAFLSAYGDEAVVREATEVGAMGYLVKPVDVPQLVPFIEASIARAREMEGLRSTTGHLERALSAEQKTRTAVGIVMVHKMLDRQQAFDSLRARARAQRRKIGDVAEDIIASVEVLNRNLRDS